MKWEYQVVVGNHDAVPDSKPWLDRHGLQEWELVTVVNIAGTATLKYYFKRPLRDTASST